MNKKNILYLSTSDIRIDSRILKSMRAAYELGATVHAIGISDRQSVEQLTNIKAEKFRIDSINLLSRRRVLLPKFIRHFITLIEFYLKSFFLCRITKPVLITDFID
jgi:hypothetical protein